MANSVKPIGSNGDSIKRWAPPVPSCLSRAGRDLYALVQSAFSTLSKPPKEKPITAVPNFKSDSLALTRRMIPLQSSHLGDVFGLESAVDLFTAILKVHDVWEKYKTSDRTPEKKIRCLKNLVKPIALAAAGTVSTASKVTSITQKLFFANCPATSLSTRSVTILNGTGASIFAALILGNVISSILELRALCKAHTIENPQTKQIARKAFDLVCQLMLLSGLVIAIVGIFSTIAAPVAYVGTILILMSSIITCGKSAVAFYQWMRAENPQVGEYDKIIHLFNLFIIALSIASFIAISIVSGGIPIYVMVISALIYASWIGISALTLYRIHTLEKKINP